jgi:poly(ADP-ribose) glycohydrolase ARH3
MLGLALGDAIGAPFEGLGPYDIYKGFCFGHNIVANPPEELLHYTDDTQMMIALAEHLIDARIDEGDGESEQALMRRFVENFDEARGYGPGARRLIQAAAEGEDWRALRHTINPGGSFGNGAAMRVAPIGLLFCNDFDRVWDEAERSALPTHTHPIGIEGAQLVALSVAVVSRMTTFESRVFFEELCRRAVTEEFRWQLSVASDPSLVDSPAYFGNDLRADRSVVTAIVSFAAHPDSYCAAVGRALGFGGDTDTLAAMTGAISGAFLGVGALPRCALDRLENGAKGGSHIRQLAERLAAKATAAR